MATSRRSRLLLAFVVTVGVLAACSDSGSDDEATSTTTAAPTSQVSGTPTLDEAKTEQMQTIIEEVSAENGIPGAAVVVTQGDERWSTVVGISDMETDEPMAEGLDWPLRSITKSFTVTMVLQFVDEGLVSLDGPIGEYVEGIPSGDEVTVRQLAEMTSGLPDYTNQAFIDAFVADTGRQFSVDELIGYAVEDPMQAEPGTERVYTNLNTLVLGRLVEEITGQGFEVALDEQILEPLDLDATVYPTDPDQWTTDIVGYSPGSEGTLEADPVNYSVFGPAGAMIATLDDLAAWGPALGSGELIDAATQAERIDGAPLEEGPEYDHYGLGIGELDGWWGHTGEGFGFTALVMYDEATDTTVAIAMNASGLDEHIPTQLFRQLAPVLSES